jgi:hypothetical protein
VETIGAGADGKAVWIPGAARLIGVVEAIVPGALDTETTGPVRGFSTGAITFAIGIAVEMPFRTGASSWPAEVATELSVVATIGVSAERGAVTSTVGTASWIDGRAKGVDVPIPSAGRDRLTCGRTESLGETVRRLPVAPAETAGSAAWLCAGRLAGGSTASRPSTDGSASPKPLGAWRGSRTRRTGGRTSERTPLMGGLLRQM